LATPHHCASYPLIWSRIIKAESTSANMLALRDQA